MRRAGKAHGQTREIRRLRCRQGASSRIWRTSTALSEERGAGAHTPVRQSRAHEHSGGPGGERRHSPWREDTSRAVRAISSRNPPPQRPFCPRSRSPQHTRSPRGTVPEHGSAVDVRASDWAEAESEKAEIPLAAGKPRRVSLASVQSSDEPRERRGAFMGVYDAIR